MSVSVTTHLNFRGEAREALEFYRSVFGGDLTVVAYEDMGDVGDPAEARQVMWGQVAADNGFRVMAFDMPSSRSWDPGEEAFFVALRGGDPEEISALWERLADGATVRTPLAPAPWGVPLYGMLTDRFGTTWVVDVEGEHASS